MVYMGIKITVLDTLDGRGKKYSQAFLCDGCTGQIAQYSPISDSKLFNSVIVTVIKLVKDTSDLFLRQAFHFS